MALRFVVASLFLAVAIVNGALLNFGSLTTPQPAANNVVTTGSRGLFGGILDKTGNIISNVKDGVNKITNDTTNMISSATVEAKQFLSTLENGSSCKCSGLNCGCCADATLASMKSKFCTNLGVVLSDMSIQLSAHFNDKTLFSTQLITGKNPPPICAPLGPVPAVTLCIRPYELSLGLTGFRVCLQLETAVLGKTIATASFNCFRISSMGTLTMETVDQNPNKGYVNLNVSSILPYLPASIQRPINLPIYPISLLTGK